MKLPARPKLVLTGIALLLLISGYLLWSYLASQADLERNRARLQAVLQQANHSLLIVFNERVRIPLLGAAFSYELKIDRTSGVPFRGRSLRLEPAGSYDPLNRELFTASYVDTSRPDVPPSAAGTFALAPSGLLFDERNRPIFDFSLVDMSSPYRSENGQAVILPPVGYVQRGNYLELIGLGIPEAMEHSPGESWSRRVELIARSAPLEDPESEVVALESFQILLGESENNPSARQTQSWHCSLEHEAHRRLQQESASPLLWNDCRLQCRCSVSVERSGCLASGIIDVPIILDTAVCAHPFSSSVELQDVSCSRQTMLLAERNEICQNVCGGIAQSTDGPFAALLKKQPTSLDVESIGAAQFLGCGSYGLQNNNTELLFCDLRDNEEPPTWQHERLISYFKGRVQDDYNGIVDPSALFELQFQACLNNPPPAPARHSSNQSPEAARATAPPEPPQQEAATPATSSLCMKKNRSWCSLDTIVEDPDVNSKTRHFIYFTPRMEIGQGEKCSDFTMIAENYDAQTNSWRFAERYPNRCQTEGDDCSCSCKLELLQGLPASLRTSRSVERIRVLITKDRNAAALCGTQVTIALQ